MTFDRPESMHRRARYALMLSTAMCAAVIPLTLASGSAGATAAETCLWAGSQYPPGNTVVAGGWQFTCGVSSSGTPLWSRGASTTAASTVANPGAAQAPVGQFSAGAMQPGTEYTDYCVGTQLVSGSDSIYEVRSDATGLLFWKAVPTVGWAYDPGAAPVPSTRSSALCLPEVVF
ncbi:hypothetical protein [Nocardia asteroides]|uniref:hypothetical protein n=1 Tax=Nocardia asteroides TaxID=1824 RepID=UPI003413C3F8